MWITINGPLWGFLSNTVEEWMLPVDVLPPAFTSVQTKPAACQAHHAHPFLLCLAYQVEHSVYCEAYLQSL